MVLLVFLGMLKLVLERCLRPGEKPFSAFVLRSPGSAHKEMLCKFDTPRRVGLSGSLPLSTRNSEVLS
jgi:hypothetical protein